MQLQAVENLVQNRAAVEYFRKICRPKTLIYLPPLPWLQPASALCNVGMSLNHFLHSLSKYFFLLQFTDSYIDSYIDSCIESFNGGKQ